MDCDSIQEGATKNYPCAKEKGHTGNHVCIWKEKGIVTIDGEKVEGEIALMTWW